MPEIWITVSEAQAIFGKWPRAIQYAIWKEKVKARQAVVGNTWLLEYSSCVNHWGKPANVELVERIYEDVGTAM